MNNNFSLEQYKKKKIAELKDLGEQILKYHDDLPGGGPNGTGMYKNQPWLPYNFKNNNVDWTIRQINNICYTKEDVDIIFKWKEAEFK